jgi:membrane-associated phospholipid phosphatase
MTRASFLGSHTFFMLFLPLYFFGDFSNLRGASPAEVEARRVLGERLRFFGRTMVFLLSEGVYLTGCVKDYFMLPRPPSPPIVRLSVHQLAEEASAHAADKRPASIDTTTHLEYGFPSTHSANALAMSAVSALFIENCFADFVPPGAISAIWVLLFGQYLLVAISRVYCGMHAAVDVVGGTVIGCLMVLSWLGMGGHSLFEAFLGLAPAWIVIVAIPILFGLLPMCIFPLQGTCPCFDDCVCFTFTVVGVCLGTVFNGEAGFPPKLADDFDAALGMSALEILLRCLVRTVVGLGLIIVWRLMVKALGHKVFPPLLGTKIGGPRTKMSPEQVTRTFSYTGIGIIATFVAPLVFNTLGL